MTLHRLLHIAAASVIFWSGCSLEYQELAETLDDEIPSLRMNIVTVVTVEDGREKVRVQADSLEDYENTFRRIIQGAEFTEFDANGEVSASGRAEQIEFDTRTDNAVLKGSIFFTSKKDSTTVSAEYLEWNDDERRLSGKPDEEVYLQRNNGTRIQGYGFSAEFPSRRFLFNNGVSGRYLLDTGDEGEETES